MKKFTTLVTMAVFALTLALTLGCGSDTSCKDVCACEGLVGDKTCINQCETDRTNAKEAAAKAGCAAQQEALFTCTADNSSCDSIRLEFAYPTSACSAESTAFTKCSMGTSSSSSGQ